MTALGAGDPLSYSICARAASISSSIAILVSIFKLTLEPERNSYVGLQRPHVAMGNKPIPASHVPDIQSLHIAIDELLIEKSPFVKMFLLIKRVWEVERADQESFLATDSAAIFASPPGPPHFPPTDIGHRHHDIKLVVQTLARSSTGLPYRPHRLRRGSRYIEAKP